MSKRVGIIALLQESNTFIHGSTTIEHFEQDLLATGEEVRARLANAHHEVGGFFAGLAEQGIEAVPIFAARAIPYGVMAAETFNRLMEMLETEVRHHLPLDGLLVAPHGATVSQDVPDVDGYWLRMLRNLVGPECPIIGTIDPHANLSPAMVDATDALIAYRTNPHIDQRERGLDAVRLLAATLRGEVRPRQAAIFPPLAINIECQQTATAPCQPLYEAADRIRARPGILSTSICLGFPYADVAEMGAAVLAVADRDRELAHEAASDLAEAMWASRKKYVPQLTSIDDALALLERLEDTGRLDRPVCLLDMGDNIGGGSPGDGTWLAHVLHHRKRGPAFVAICDPAAVDVTQHAAIGAQLELSIGGKLDSRNDPPLTVSCVVIARTSGRFTESRPRHGGFTDFDQGPTTVVRTDSGLTIMVTSRRMAPYSLEQIRHCGLDPRSFRVLIAKGVHAPVAAYQEVCRQFIRVNTPGVTSADLGSFEYQHRRRPMFPFEPDAQWSPRCQEAMR